MALAVTPAALGTADSSYAVPARVTVFPIPGSRVAIAYGVYGVPETFVIGRDVRIAYKLIGPVTPDNLQTDLKPAIERALANP